MEKLFSSGRQLNGRLSSWRVFFNTITTEAPRISKNLGETRDSLAAYEDDEQNNDEDCLAVKWNVSGIALLSLNLYVSYKRPLVGSRSSIRAILSSHYLLCSGL